MDANFAEIADLLFCPDDGAALHLAAKELYCSFCSRRFPILANNLVEILPQRPIDLLGSVNSSFRDNYLKIFEQGYRSNDTDLAWGAEETVPESWIRKRRREVAAVRPLIAEGTKPGESVLCDISAGAGYYTFAYADLFRFVIHGDLSVNNLSYAWRKARSQDLQNIFFLRLDYFALPFRQSLDRVLCMDTLIHGEAHDSRLLGAVTHSLKPTGSAVVDLHNWWHNPVRRLGFLPDNFSNNRSYGRTETERLLRRAGIHRYECFSFRQEFESWDSDWPSLSRFFPATRFLFRTYGTGDSRNARQACSGARRGSFDSSGENRLTLSSAKPAHKSKVSTAAAEAKSGELGTHDGN